MASCPSKETWPCTTWGSTDNYPVVLLHGFMQNGFEWEEVGAALASNYYVCAPTIEAGSPHEASLESLAQHVLAIAHDARERTKSATFALVGYSMGGRIALSCARLSPNTLGALVLESSGLGPENDQERRLAAARNAQMLERLRTQGLEAFVSWWEELPLFASQRSLPAETRNAIRTMRLGCNPQQVALLLEHAGAHTMPSANSARALLAQAPFSTLYLAGARDAKYAALAESLPLAVQAHAIDAGHNVHVEQQPAFLQAVETFLEVAMPRNKALRPVQAPRAGGNTPEPQCSH